MPESSEHRPDSPGAAKPDPNELVILTCSVFMLMHRRNTEGQVVATECHEIPRITTRQDAEDLIRDGLIPPGCIAPLDPPSPSDGR
jgi:hypothetical protein